MLSAIFCVYIFSIITTSLVEQNFHFIIWDNVLQIYILTLHCRYKVKQLVN